MGTVGGIGQCPIQKDQIWPLEDIIILADSDRKATTRGWLKEYGVSFHPSNTWVPPWLSRVKGGSLTVQSLSLIPLINCFNPEPSSAECTKVRHKKVTLPPKYPVHPRSSCYHRAQSAQYPQKPVPSEQRIRCYNCPTADASGLDIYSCNLNCEALSKSHWVAEF